MTFFTSEWMVDAGGLFMWGTRLQRSLCLFAIYFFSSVSTASVEVYGVEQDSMSTVRDREQIVARLDATWTHIRESLKVPESSDPLIYLYPFDRTIQPEILTSLQDRFVEGLPELKNQPTKLAKLFSLINGITYDLTLFDADSDKAGRLIQINTDRSYRNENESERGYGLYITAHEMVHVALNRLGIDKKYQHCLMVDEDARGQSLMRKVLNYLLQDDWISPMLSGQMPMTKGYAEEASHCMADVQAIKRSDGPIGLTKFWDEIRAIHHRLGY